jgi:murein DD-endopeptidase MepM/ murein hydrolase activator NlpD
MAAGNNEGLIESKAVIEDVGGEDKTLLETELENEAEKDKTLLEAALDNAPAMHSDNTDLSAMPEIEAKLSNWPAGTFELPIFWGTGREILRPYGLSFAATYGDYRYHGGWDFAVGLHEEVLCSAPGVVVKTDYSEADKYAVLIRHGDGWESSYQQLTEVRVAVDESVGLGQVIGIIGEPGVQELAEGPHLHWELWHHGARQDPAKLVDATVSGEAQ